MESVLPVWSDGIGFIPPPTWWHVVHLSLPSKEWLTFGGAAVVAADAGAVGVGEAAGAGAPCVGEAAG